MIVKAFLWIMIVIGFSFNTYGQKVEILLKDGSKRTEGIKASSNTQLFVSSGAINYSDIESVKFDSDNPNDKKLKEKLSIARVNIFVGEERQIIDVARINDEPRKGDKKIVLVCSDSLEALYKRVGQHLSSKGYAIENANRDFFTIKTALRATSKLNFNYFLNIVIIDKKVSITAQWKLNNSILTKRGESGFFDWEFVNANESTFSMTVNSIIYNDIIRNFNGFDRLRIEYE